jgi:pimeloyl-ACP methyl ester carboxylesterase
VSDHRIVLLHGQPGSAADWQQLAGRLPETLGIVALDRPGYGASRLPAGGFRVNARAVLAELDARGIERAVLAGHSYGGGVALSVAQLAPGRVEALILLASVGPGCLTGSDRLLAAPVTGELTALALWRLTPWLASSSLAATARLRGRPIAADEYVYWQLWASARFSWCPGPATTFPAARLPASRPRSPRSWPRWTAGPPHPDRYCRAVVREAGASS